MSISSYMFRPPIVAIFRELFLKDILRSKSKSLQILNVEIYVKGLIFMLEYKILMKLLFVLNCVFICCVR